MGLLANDHLLNHLDISCPKTTVLNPTVGNALMGNWTGYVGGLYTLGQTSLIAHFKIAGMQLAMETNLNVLPRTGAYMVT